MVNGSPGLMRGILSRGVFTNEDYGNDTSRCHKINRYVLLCPRKKDLSIPSSKK